MLQINENNGVVIVQINDSDRLNAVVAEDVKKELATIVSQKKSNVILNLANIKFIDSTGIGVLISALKTARQNNNDFSLSNVQGDVLSLLTLMKLDKVFDIIED